MRAPYLGPESELRVYRGKLASADEIPAVAVDLGPAAVEVTLEAIMLPACPDCGCTIRAALRTRSGAP